MKETIILSTAELHDRIGYVVSTINRHLPDLTGLYYKQGKQCKFPEANVPEIKEIMEKVIGKKPFKKRVKVQEEQTALPLGLDTIRPIPHVEDVAQLNAFEQQKIKNVSRVIDQLGDEFKAVVAQLSAEYDSKVNQLMGTV